MYTVKIKGTGSLIFGGRSIRVPATLKKISDKQLKLIKVMCRAHSLEFEILEEESDRLARVTEKLHDDSLIENIDEEIENSETIIEDLFESDDTLGKLLGEMRKE